MFELSVALKYLSPRWRQLSVSIISLISILVIALVVWLIVVFFSVTNGLEKTWTQKLITLTAPIRITPTEAYYNSYYYQVDAISDASDYSHKTISEKRNSSLSDPYNPSFDEEAPSFWTAPDVNEDGTLKDIVKNAFEAINAQPKHLGISANDYEMTTANLRLRLVRDSKANFGQHDKTQAFLSQAAYLGSFDQNHQELTQTLLPISMADLNNVLEILTLAANTMREDTADAVLQLDPKVIHSRLETFFDTVDISELKTSPAGWVIPTSLWPTQALFQVCAIVKSDRLQQIIIPQEISAVSLLKNRLERAGNSVKLARLHIENGIAKITVDNGNESLLPKYVSLVVESELPIPAKIVPDSLKLAREARDIQFFVSLMLQGIHIEGIVPYNNLEINKAKFLSNYDTQPKSSPFWLYQLETPHKIILPSDAEFGEGILLPRSFKEAGTLLGDRGFLSYYTPTTSSVQEQRLLVHVAGFYDPGMIPIGGKYVLVNQNVTRLIRASHNQENTTLSNGINVRFPKLDSADDIKKRLQQAFDKAGISPYWKIETFREYDFTKDLIQQLHSEKNLWMLIATVIIIVACSNIISMLIILVNDKKVEIGILRSMGATSVSIAFIFGFCGVTMGLVGSVTGTLVAIITLKNLKVLVDFISGLQGYDAFNPLYYGNSLPNEVSLDALMFVVFATSLISLLAGIVPAVKASMLRPSSILRSE